MLNHMITGVDSTLEASCTSNACLPDGMDSVHLQYYCNESTILSLLQRTRKLYLLLYDHLCCNWH